MKRSTERILTTHTGSLPRPDDLVSLLYARDKGEAVDEVAFERRVQEAVKEVIRKQVEAGLTVINDGEMGKVGYSTYVKDRLTGFEGEARGGSRLIEATQFPSYFQRTLGTMPAFQRPACSGPISWKGDAGVRRDVATFRAALEGVSPEDRFLSAASPGVAGYFLPNQYYPSHEAYIFAVADAMQHEYRAIHDAGFLLQVDCPDLAMSWNSRDFADKTVADFRRYVEVHVAALNHALAEIPAEDVRMHVCWGNYEGPHLRDVPFREIVETILKAKPSAISFEAANPRHEHEWRIWEDVKLPDGKILIPGVLDSTTNFVEHPRLVADRIGRFARLVGRENVIAGTDCGFSTFAGFLTVDPQITWLKLAALAEGAQLASAELWRD
ncbi:MAG: cobalamin-independent methionine synthase II family protein [Chloroflexota bacterium]